MTPIGAPLATRRETCASCQARDLQPVIELGLIPLAGAFPSTLESPAHAGHPLSVVVCLTCNLVQVAEEVSPELLFSDYRYLATPPLRQHFETFAGQVPDQLGLSADALIVEIGCNDGVLLRPLLSRGFSNLVGVDPAVNVTTNVPPSIPVINGFFGRSIAEEIVSERGHAEAVLANNVFAHVDDLDDFLGGVTHLLGREGWFVFEVHYLVDLLERFQFDTIYHEHRFYYSITALTPLLARHGLTVCDVCRISNHGGSVRVFASTKPQEPRSSVREALAYERSSGLTEAETYVRFQVGVRDRVSRLVELVREIPSSERLVAYGAAGRAVTLLNFVPEVASRIDYVVDESPERVGRYIPGVRIPVVDPSRLAEDQPERILITAWTYAATIKRKIEAGKDGIVPGRSSPVELIVPLPVPRYL